MSDTVPSDFIDDLPVDKNPPSESEMNIINSIFSQKQNIRKLLLGTQDVLLVGFIFILFSLPQIDEYIMKIFPSTTKSPYILIGLKTILFMLFYFISKNIYLARKNK
jgi:hypothetical protein